MYVSMCLCVATFNVYIIEEVIETSLFKNDPKNKDKLKNEEGIKNEDTKMKVC